MVHPACFSWGSAEATGVGSTTCVFQEKLHLKPWWRQQRKQPRKQRRQLWLLQKKPRT